MSVEVDAIITWRCSKCHAWNEAMMSELDYNYHTDRCNDMERFFFFLVCSKCENEDVSYSSCY